MGDDDDFALGSSKVFGTGAMRELYLINKNQKTRLFFRWNIKQDPNASVTCVVTESQGKTTTNSGCVGNIQVLRLNGYDIGLSHSGISV